MRFSCWRACAGAGTPEDEVAVLAAATQALVQQLAQRGPRSPASQPSVAGRPSQEAPSAPETSQSWAQTDAEALVDADDSAQRSTAHEVQSPHIELLYC